MEDPEFPALFSAAERPGTYLRIVEEGSLTAGDRIEIGAAPNPGLTVADVPSLVDEVPFQALEDLVVMESA